MDKKQTTENSRVIRTGPKTNRFRKRPVTRAERVFFAVLKTVGKVILTTVLVFTITGCIVGTALTVYVMGFIDSEVSVKLEDLKMNFNSSIYAKDAENNDVIVQSLVKGHNRIWVDLKDVPQHVQDAFVYSEDERFWVHGGVDFKRTIAAFANMVLNPNGDRFGGSTITQQLIKNINADFDDRTVDDKIKEIMIALNLERHYSKEQILELYLNYVGLHYASGIQAGANYYFGKNVSELSYAEAAALAVTTKSPSSLNPKSHPKENEDRRENYVGLKKMLEFGKITQEEYDAACAETLVIKGSMVSSEVKETSIQSYYVDAVIEEVVADLASQYNYTKDYAEQVLYTSGYQVYSNMEIETQKILEKYFTDPATFETPQVGDKEHPQASMVIQDLDGNIRALVGGMGEKKESRGFNRATMSARPAGSTIKPLAIYAPAFENNLITWSSIMTDKPVTTTIDKKTGNERGYPQNYDWVYGGDISIIEAIKVSKNTIPFELSQILTPRASFDFVNQDLGLKSLKDPANVNEASMALGDGGVILTELTGAFQVFGNGGYFTEPKLYSKVVDAGGKVILDATVRTTKQVLSSDTAYVINKALWRVVNESPGSGTAGKLENFETIGKTGTSNDRKDLLFVGVTPYYVAGIRYGYDDNDIIIPGKKSFQIPVWQKIMTEIHAGKNPANFELNNQNVVELEYCTFSGLLATENCPAKKKGFYRTSNVPPTCNSTHTVAPEGDPASSGEETSSTPETIPSATNLPDGEIIIQE